MGAAENWLDDTVEDSQHEVMEMRQATAEDVPVLAELGAEVQALHHAVRPDWFKPPDAKAAEPLYTQLLQDRAVVAYLAEYGPARPLGYVIARVLRQPRVRHENRYLREILNGSPLTAYRLWALS